MKERPYHHLPDGTFRNPEGSPQRDHSFNWSFKIFNEEKKKLNINIPPDHVINKREVDKLIGKINREGFTIIPTKMYFKKGKAKVEIAVAKGKKQYDKRHTKKKRDWNRERARFFRKSS